MRSVTRRRALPVRTTQPSSGSRKSILESQPEKHGRVSRGFRVTYQEVYAVLATYLNVARVVLDRFKTEGGDRNRWSLLDQALMADELTRAEDALELMHASTARVELRARLRDVRMRLELASIA